MSNWRRRIAFRDVRNNPRFVLLSSMLISVATDIIFLLSLWMQVFSPYTWRMNRCVFPYNNKSWSPTFSLVYPWEGESLDHARCFTTASLSDSIFSGYAHLPPLDGVEGMTKFGSNPLYISQDSSVFLDHGLVQAVGIGFTASRCNCVTRWCWISRWR